MSTVRFPRTYQIESMHQLHPAVRHGHRTNAHLLQQLHVFRVVHRELSCPHSGWSAGQTATTVKRTILGNLAKITISMWRRHSACDETYSPTQRLFLTGVGRLKCLYWRSQTLHVLLIVLVQMLDVHATAFELQVFAIRVPIILKIFRLKQSTSGITANYTKIQYNFDVN